MTQKEKAKAYDEAVQKVKDYYDGKTKMYSDINKALELIFPELQESEDERTRKEIIDFIYDNETEETSNAFKWIAWLEKQGEKSQRIVSAEAKDALYSMKTPLDKAAEEEVNARLEKQGNPTNKIKQKFHEGDWIVYKNDICQIVKREEGCNKLVTTFGIEKELVNERNLSTARLWTIADAKDGDVLAWDDSKCIALFKNIYDKDSFNSYGFVGHCTGVFESRLSYHDIKGAHPATKEQRNFLFSKMNEAGYKLDAESKKLIKVEDSEDEKISTEKRMEIPKGNDGEISQKWTVEDEQKMSKCKSVVLFAKDGLSLNDKTELKRWLDSLKQRIVQ